MNRKNRFILNVLYLTVSSLIMRLTSLYFNVYLKSILGEEGVGLFSLIMSVYSFALTLATSGINLATTRLCSEALERGRYDEIRKTMKSASLYCIFFGVLSSLLLFFLSPLIGAHLINDTRTIPSLMILSVTLTLISISSALSGYFTAVRRVSKNALTQVAEQCVRIGATILLFNLISPKSLTGMCFLVVLGAVISDTLSFLATLVFYVFDSSLYRSSRSVHRCAGTKRKLLSIALPVAFSAYFRSGLLTVEHMLIPWGLKKSGSNSALALSRYGCVQGMALPIILFPYALLAPFCSLTVPEISSRMAINDRRGVKRLCERAMRYVLIFGIGCSVFMIFSSELLGSVLYHSDTASSYIKILSPLVPIMYIDTCIDSVLKGIGEQTYSMKVNVFDAILSVFLVFMLTPRFGINGYVFCIIICETVNTSLSFTRLYKVIKPSLSFLAPLPVSLICGIISSALLNNIFSLIKSANGYVLLALLMVSFCTIYFSLMLFAKKISSLLKNRPFRLTSTKKMV